MSAWAGLEIRRRFQLLQPEPDHSLLSERTLHRHAGRVALPQYEREALMPGVVHFGVGGFHRAHQATYFDDLANQGEMFWGVVGVGLKSRGMKQGLGPQQGLYTVVERGAQNDRARVIGSLRGCLFGPESPGAVVGALSQPTTRLVTLTITGDAYCSAEDPARAGAPPTVFDFIAEALARRRRTGIAPFTVLSCDNLPENGEVTRAAVVEAARRRDDLLARWIDHRVAFPDSVVDRITPEGSAEARRLVQARFGIRDRRPVVTEPFRQWIVEDAFCNDRPPLDSVGVEFVRDVRPYGLIKRRLLNGGHSALGYVGALCGYRRTDEALADPVVRDYLERLMRDEISPLLPAATRVDLERYRRALLARFANPRMGDELARLCRRGTTKMPAYLLPSLTEADERGMPTPLLTQAVAAWYRYLRGRTDRGAAIDVHDARLAKLAPLVRSSDPRAFLHAVPGFEPVRANEAFVRSLEAAIQRMDSVGVRGALGELGADAALERAA